MEPAWIALDIQALQPGSGAPESRRRRVAGTAGALARRGRLAAALVAPERPPPPPDELPAELRGAGAERLRWDGRAETRRLMARHPRLVHHVPSPRLHARPEDPGGLVASTHWGDSGVPRVVTLDGNDVARLSGPIPSRLRARLEWIRTSRLIELDLDKGTDPAPPTPLALAGLLGIEPGRLADAGTAVERLDAGLDAGLDSSGQPPGAMPHHIAVFGPFPPGGGGIGDYNARFVTALSALDGVRVHAVSTTGLGWDAPPGVGRVHAESFGTDVRPASYDTVIYTLGNSDGHLATVEAALRHPGWLWLHEARLPAVATTALASLDDDAFAAAMVRLLGRAYPGRPPLAAARSAGRSHLALAAGGVGLTFLLAERAAGLVVNSDAARRSLLLDLPPLAWTPPVAVLPPACPPPRPRRAAGQTSEAPASGQVAGAPASGQVSGAPASGQVSGTPASGQTWGATASGQVSGGVGAGDRVVSFGVVSMGKRPELLVDAAAVAGCRLAFVGPCPDILRMVIRDRATARGIDDRVEVTGRLDDDGWWAWMEAATLAVQLRDSAGGEMSAAVLDALSAGVPVLTNLASARDYPPGTVELIEAGSPSADQLADAIRPLLGRGGADRRAELSRHGRRFAAEHQMQHLAEAVLGAVNPAP